MTLHKRYLTLTAVLVLAAAAVLIGLMLVPDKPALPNRVLLPNTGGRVVFNHVQHAEDYGIACETCHHENSAARPDPLACGSCHGVEFDKAFVETHRQTFKGDTEACLTCHHMEFESANWDRDLHDLHAETLLEAAGMEDKGCQTCHHDESIEPEPMSCKQCHETLERGKPVPASADVPLYRDAVHARCASCHAHSDSFKPGAEGLKLCSDCHQTEKTKETFAAGKLEPVEQMTFSACASCHYDPAVDEIMLGRMAAFHKQCGDCHTDMDRGPRTDDTKQCNQCHIR